MTILQLLQRGDDDAAAIAALDKAPLDYRGLRLHVEKTRSALGDLGFGGDDRIAIVLPAGPELATALLTVGSMGAAAPLNPAYGCEELELLMLDLKVSAVLTSASAGESAHKAALARGLPLLHAESEDGAAAGLFDVRLMNGKPKRERVVSDAPGPSDTALLLHTSGTTSRPKLVPLQQSQLAVGAQNVAAALGLRADDRCLAVMPLFHIHGIVASVLATLSTGGTVVCSRGFTASGFFESLQVARPTWTTAVPTMLHTLLSRAPDSPPQHTLRLIRTSSLALPPSLMSRLEDYFGIPVLEALGMTEASHQVTVNPPPPGERRPGSVGVASGPSIAILDEAGTIIGEATTGELLVRGPNVFEGYERNPEANERSFIEGWFRTGDLASIERDGYVTITGRLKELINRGGEKIGPREVEEILLDHPAVDQVVVFPAPHRSLGEEVAAAVVLAAGNEATPHQLRAHVREHLAAFKVPRKLLIVDAIPKGPTGKPQRLTMAATLGLDEARDD